MIIKKYIATTEKEAVSLAKAELGEDVTIMNIKENNPKGLSRLFKKSSVEVTAAIDDVKTESKTPERKKEHTDFAKLQQALDGNGFTPAPDSKTARMVIRSISRILPFSLTWQIEIAIPVFPARPVRPRRWV